MTIRLKVVAVLLTLLTLSAATISLIGAATLRGALTTQTDERLAATTERLLDTGGWRTNNLNTTPFPSLYSARVVEDDGTVIREVGNPSTLPEITPNTDTRITEARNIEGSTWRILTTEVPTGDHLIVGTQIDDIEETVQSQLQLYILIGAAAVLLTGTAGFLLMSQSLKPLRRVEKTAGEIASGNLSLRVPVGRDEETRSLSAALNLMLERLEEAFQRERETTERTKRFVSDASHELRTPLTSIRGFAELAKNTEAAETKAALQRIEREAARMSRLVEDLLLLARLDEEAPLRDEEVDLLAVALDTVAAGDARGGNVHLTEGPHIPIHVRGDDDRIRQVAANLLGNALEHTPPGTRIEIGIREEADRGILYVHDEGPGIDPDTQQKIFDRFYRADPSRTRTTGGSGLGLSIVAAVTTALKGEVTIESTPGKGTTFTISLPLNPSTGK